jgi:hypothetical protein
MTSATFQLWFLTKAVARSRNASFSAVAALGADLAPVEEITFSDDAYQHIAIVDDRKPAYPLGQHYLRSVFHAVVGLYSDDIRFHQILDAHLSLRWQDRPGGKTDRACSSAATARSACRQSQFILICLKRAALRWIKAGR